MYCIVAQFYLNMYIFVVTLTIKTLNLNVNKEDMHVLNTSISGNNVTVTWTLPGESETFTYLAFYSSGSRENETYIKTPQSSYTITLTSCKKYRLEMQCAYHNHRRSKTVGKTFWVTSK
jgi:hypothetical protein